MAASAADAASSADASPPPPRTLHLHMQSDAEAMQEILHIRKQVEAVLRIQDHVRGTRLRRREGEAATVVQNFVRRRSVRLSAAAYEADPPASPDVPDATAAATTFTLRNLDTCIPPTLRLKTPDWLLAPLSLLTSSSPCVCSGEATVMLEETDQLTEGDGPLPPELRSKLSFGALQPHTSAWEVCVACVRSSLCSSFARLSPPPPPPPPPASSERPCAACETIPSAPPRACEQPADGACARALAARRAQASKAECCGVLEKLASRSTLSFRSYELCVWQERYVYTEVRRTPVGWLDQAARTAPGGVCRPAMRDRRCPRVRARVDAPA